MILFQLGKNLLLVDTFTEYIGLNNRNQQRQEIIITQPGRIIIEEYQEHDGHQIHHELHTRHLLLSGGILHIDFGVYQVGNSHQQTEKADVITKIGRYQRYISVPTYDRIIGRQIFRPQERFTPKLDRRREEGEHRNKNRHL